MIAVDLQRAKLSWEWAQGDGGVAESFHIKCGAATGSYTILVAVADPALRIYPLSAVVTSPGRYFCTVSALNQFAESANANEVSFEAGLVPTAPSNLLLQAN